MEISRREGRYRRRRQKREEHRVARAETVGSIEDVFTFRDLYQAGRKCCNGVRWKNSTQRFELHLFSNTAKNRRRILDGEWEPSPYVHFTIRERGKARPIDAPLIRDRQVHKVLAKKALIPLYGPEMIRNNGASLEGKGYRFSRRMLEDDLRRHFRKYGREGSIILMDFQKFFPTASHEVLFRRHGKFITDPGLRKMADDIVSSMPGGEGMPLGVEPSQIEMVAFPSALDNFIKCQLSMEGAGHYMDDYYILVPPGQDPEEILMLAAKKAGELSLTVNRGKTRIRPLTKPFRFCKAKYTVTETGRVIANGSRDSMKRARRKIKAFPGKIGRGEMTYSDLWGSVGSMLSYFEGYDDHGRVLALRRLFFAVFGFSAEQYGNFTNRRNSNGVYRTQAA